MNLDANDRQTDISDVKILINLLLVDFYTKLISKVDFIYLKVNANQENLKQVELGKFSNIGRGNNYGKKYRIYVGKYDPKLAFEEDYSSFSHIIVMNAGYFNPLLIL